MLRSQPWKQLMPPYGLLSVGYRAESTIKKLSKDGFMWCGGGLLHLVPIKGGVIPYPAEAVMSVTNGRVRTNHFHSWMCDYGLLNRLR